MSYSEIQKALKEAASGKALTNKEITEVVDKALSQTSGLMIKHDFHNFLDSLKGEGKLLVIGHIYNQISAKPGLDLYYFRTKIEEMYRDGLVSNPASYLELLNIANLAKDLPEWSANSLHLLLEKCLDVGKDKELLTILRQCSDKLSTIKVVDLLKKMIILDKISLSEQFLEVVLDSKNHGKSCLETFIQLKTSAIKNRQAIDTLIKLRSKVKLEDYMGLFIKSLIVNSNYEEIVAVVDYIEHLNIELPTESVSALLMCFLDYDDWTSFKKCFSHFHEEKKVSENTIKKIISSLVEKESIDLLKYVISITMTNIDSFLSLKLTENQYKFIVLALVKSHMDLSNKLNAQNGHNQDKIIGMQTSPRHLPKAVAQSEISGQDGQMDDAAKSVSSVSVNGDLTSSFKDVGESDSEDAFEIIDEAMIQKIIKEVAIHEKKHQHK